MKKKEKDKDKDKDKDKGKGKGKEEGRWKGLGKERKRKKLEEDPVRALRYLRFATRYGNPDDIADSDRTVLGDISNLLDITDDEGNRKIPINRINDEFMDALGCEDIDRRKYLGLCKSCNFTQRLFPGLHVHDDFPPEISEVNDKLMPVAWMLRSEHPGALQMVLRQQNWNSKDLQKIMFLIKSLMLSPDMDDDAIDNIADDYRMSGMPEKHFRTWLNRIGKLPEDLVNKFLTFIDQPKSIS